MPPPAPLSTDTQKLLFEVSKQLITLSVVALGFITSMLFTSFKGTPYVPSALTALFGFLLSAACGVLTQLAVVAESLGSVPQGRVRYPQLLLHLTWVTFVAALVAFVVFTVANLRAMP